MKARIRGKFIGLNAYIRKEVRSQLNILCFHFNKLEKEQNKSKTSRRKDIKIKTEINETKNRKSMEKINQTESSFFEVINKIDTDKREKANSQYQG